jgi:hypothetical protein
MKGNNLRNTTLPGAQEHSVQPVSERFRPQPVRLVQGLELQIQRMYTEEEVAEILQVSLSQLRKWRMKENQDRHQGPPFRKLGRLVRYPAQALQAYINGDDDRSKP